MKKFVYVFFEKVFDLQDTVSCNDLVKCIGENVL